MSDVTWLAAAGGTALVGAAATDAWQSARQGFANLLGRGDRHRELRFAARLDGIAAELEHLPARERERTRQELVTAWTARLSDLLEDHPEVTAQLRNLVDHVQAGPPETGSGAGQTVQARDNAVQYVSQHGNVHVNHHGPQEPR
ncbi:hypothetical protein [Streptomyces caelestis]|uniref:hypothetical protein n=1 Tax=Streptomyces caelestis TaxID=36816 RepID=UPI00364ED783